MVKVGIAGVVGVVLLGGLGACGSEPKPKVADPPPTPSLSASPSPTPAAQTPEAFLRRYVKVIDQAQVTGDFAQYRKLVSPDCLGCNQFIKNIGKIYRAGGTAKFEGERILWIHRIHKDFYRVRTFSPPTRYKESASASWKTLPGGKVTFEYTLTSSGGRLLVTDTAQVAGSAP